MTAIVLHGARDLRLELAATAPLGETDVLVRIGVGGICGSDLHYYQDGGFGTVRLREPMILGHEVAGTVEAIGRESNGLRVGDAVALSPSRPCYACPRCFRNQHHHCPSMQFYGSAMPFPHVQGAFREHIVADIRQCHRVEKNVSLNQAAMAEPFAVALHAVRQASSAGSNGSLAGQRVLITGCGPIGALTLIAAQVAGAAEVVVSDLHDRAVDFALSLGAQRGLNVANDPEAMDAEVRDHGAFDVMLEASGSGRAIVAGLGALEPGGVLVQIGIGGEVTLPMNLVVAKEISVKGSFRFHPEFAWAVSLINQGRVDLSPLVSHEFGVKDAVAAFEQAGDKSSAMKVQLVF